MGNETGAHAARTPMDPDPGMQLRHTMRYRLSRLPRLYLASQWVRRGRRQKLVRRDTDLTLEGYFCSGNTFVEAAIRMTNPDLRLAHHIHSPAHVHRSLELDVPTLVLIRDPARVVPATLVKYPFLTAELVMEEWHDFYARLDPDADVVIADFDEVTRDLGAVIDRVNARFGTALERYENSAEHDARAFEMVDRWHAERWGEVRTGYMARPSEEKARTREQLLARLEADAGYIRDMERLRALYASVVSLP